MELVLGIDLGTSYFKVALFDREGELRGLGRVATPTVAEEQTLRECPVEDFWRTLREALSAALRQANAEAQDIRAVSYSSQANTFVLLDERGKAFTPLVLWTDTREGIDPALQRLWDRADFLERSGIGTDLSAGLAAGKIRWFREHRGDLWLRVCRAMTISDYLTFSLTGRTVGDAGTAALTGLLDPAAPGWWPEAMKTVELDPSLFSTPLRPGTAAGLTTTGATKALGLPAGIPFAVGSLDHHIAAIGAGLGSVATVSESTGTVIACVRTLDRYEPRRGCCTGPGVESGFYQLAWDANGAGALEWYQKVHAAGSPLTELIDEARRLPVGSDGLVALSGVDRLSGLEDFLHRGERHTQGHYVRAILEGISANLAGLIDRLCPKGRPGRIVATGGGARSDVWLQIKADLLGVEVAACACEEPACLGAAMLAAVAAGWFQKISAAGAVWASTRAIFRPDPQRHEQYAQLLRLRRS